MKNEDVVHIIIILMYTHKCHKKLLKNLVLLSAMHDIKFFIFRYNSYLTLDIYIFLEKVIYGPLPQDEDGKDIWATI